VAGAFHKPCICRPPGRCSLTSAAGQSSAITLAGPSVSLCTSCQAEAPFFALTSASLGRYRCTPPG